MSHKKYDDNFVQSHIKINNMISTWPDKLNKKDVINFVNLNNAPMIFVPVISQNHIECISRNYFYCTRCEKWLKINQTIKDIKKHASIHVPDIFQKFSKQKKECLLDGEQEKIFIKNIVFFILFETNSFISIESPFLSNICSSLPNREKLTKILEKISKHIRNEIASELLHSSCNYITFDEWNDKKNRKFLGITVRAYIEGQYKDYFLDLIQLFEETNDATILSNVIIQSLLKYKDLGNICRTRKYLSDIK